MTCRKPGQGSYEDVIDAKKECGAGFFIDAHAPMARNRAGDAGRLL